MKDVLTVNRLTRTYGRGDRALTVLEAVSFSIEESSTTAIVGPSGSGKTTLLGLCAGLDRPSSGSVTLDGVLLNDQSEEELARFRNSRLGFVFQTFQLLPTLTAIENVMVPAELLGTEHVRRRAAELLERVGLGDRTEHYPAQLSGGEQQRVALARAFINHPRVLFADEPTGNLDGETSERVEDLIFELNEQEGTTLVFVTHHLALAGRANRMLSLHKGRLAEDSADRPRAATATSIHEA